MRDRELKEYHNSQIKDLLFWELSYYQCRQAFVSGNVPAFPHSHNAHFKEE